MSLEERRKGQVVQRAGRPRVRPCQQEREPRQLGFGTEQCPVDVVAVLRGPFPDVGRQRLAVEGTSPQQQLDHRVLVLGLTSA
jgi:hypothetical protein